VLNVSGLDGALARRCAMLDLSEAISSTKSRNCRATEGEAHFALSEVCWRRPEGSSTGL